MQERGRQEEFARNEALEQLLAGLNAMLEPVHQALLAETRESGAHPVVFVFGAPRSGTTLFMQWLAVTGLCAYPSNLLSRFYGAPLVGAQIQQMLADPHYAFRDELADVHVPADFESANGKTRGALAPNEFWYFWRRFGFDPHNRYTADADLRSRLRESGFRAELEALTRVLARPFALKALIANHNIRLVSELCPDALMVWVRRTPAYNIQSLLEARERQYGDRHRWYSFEVPEVAALRDLPPLASVAGQVHAVHRDIGAALADLPEGRRLIVDYETFCERPHAVHRALAEKLGALGEAVDPGYAGPDRFDASRTWRLPDLAEQDVLRAWAEARENDPG